MNDILQLLDLGDEEIKVLDISTDGDTKTITVEKQLSEHFCPMCGFKMYSRGIKTRTARHQILQDGYKLILKIKQRRWRCSNLECNYDVSDSFSFVSKSKQTTNTTELMVLNALLNLDNTFSSVSRQFNITAAQVINIFEKHVKMKRLPLTEAISIDEVYLDMDPQCKYVLVIQDFRTGDAIDLVISRQNKDTEPYFDGIPMEERNNVKYLISDMYNPYISYVDKYFPYAVSIVDSFHVMQWIIRKIDMFIRFLLRQYRDRDRQEAEAKAAQSYSSDVRVHVSDEVYLLENHKWVMLKNEGSIDYSSPPRWNPHYRYYIDSYQIEARFLAIHEDFPKIRDMKELYVQFNSRNAGNPLQAATELDELIDVYADSQLEMFEEFSKTLKRYRQPIINSFIMEERIIKGEVRLSRLSNGPMESLNRKAKDLKRICRGFTNFDHLRNRFLFTTRKTPTIKN